jgi:signal transduction histidine kinase
MRNGIQAGSVDPERARRARQLRQELVARAAVAIVILAFGELWLAAEGGTVRPLLRLLTVLVFLVNVPYYLAARTGVRGREQAYARMFGDVLFITLGLYAAGGLAAAPYLGVYTVVPVYAAIVFSARACVLATATATVAFGAMAIAQQTGWLPMWRPPLEGASTIAVFNLLILNLVGVLAASVAEAYRQSRRRLAALNRELEQAHDESLRLTAELMRSGRLVALGEVVAGVAHEIRNVLQSAMGHVWIMRRQPEWPERLVRHAEQIEWSCASALRIVDSALETVRHTTRHSVAMSIGDIARRIVDLKAYDARRAGIELLLEFAPDFPAVTAVPLEVQQVLLNLVANAQDAVASVPGRRAITIAGYRSGDRAIVEVRDTGPGIPAGQGQRIFEPFYTTKRDGTGLGLAISAGIARDLGGDLIAANGTDGGAVFRLSLPVRHDGGGVAADVPLTS